MADTPSTRANPSGHAIKETISSLIVAFIFAFVFRGFVVEAFVIPTGSMAPTLLGKHMRFQSPESGEIWTVNPWDNSAGNPLPVQGTQSTITATDPMTRAQIGSELPADMGRKVTTLSGVPTMSREMLMHPDWAIRDTSSVKGMGGGGAPIRAAPASAAISSILR